MSAHSWVPTPYRGTSLTRERNPLGAYCRPMLRVQGSWGVLGGWAFPYGRGTPVNTKHHTPQHQMGAERLLTNSACTCRLSCLEIRVYCFTCPCPSHETPTTKHQTPHTNHHAQNTKQQTTSTAYPSTKWAPSRAPAPLVFRISGLKISIWEPKHQAPHP